MNPRIKRRQGEAVHNTSSQDILILADGRVLTHNLTPAMAAVLGKLNPDDEPMRRRARKLEGESSDELRART
jgi:hypothetical protein